MSEASSDHDDGHDMKEKRVLPSWVSSGHTKNKSMGQKMVDPSGGGVKDGKARSNACLPETSQNNVHFSKILEGVVFALSGFVNPERATLRSQALEMGGEYRPDWTSDCTMLVCAFPNTPKFRQVKTEGGTIVSKDWLTECYSQKRIVEIEPYLLHAGKPWRNSVKQFDDRHGLGYVQDEQTTSRSGKLDAKFIGSKRHVGEHATNVYDKFSPSKIKQWAIDDFSETMSWLESQDEKPEKSEIRTIAAEGIVTCLQDAIDSLGKNHDVRHVSEQWKFVPRVVKELVVLEGNGDKNQKQLASRKVIYELAIKCKEIYEEELAHVSIKKKQQKTDHAQEEKIIAAQILSDDGGFDSDETIEMTEEEINLACRQFPELCE